MENNKIRVARVLSKTRLVLNVGSRDGIQNNSKFLIYSIDKRDIIDPASGESLGSLEIIKGSGHVIHLQEKICTIETFTKDKGRRVIKRTNPIWGNYFGYNIGAETETEEIPSDELKEFDDVKEGDYAKLF